MRPLRNPWGTAALLLAAAVLPYLLPLPGKWRLLSAAQLRQAFVAPFRGEVRARPWERIAAKPQTPSPGLAVPVPSTGPAAAAIAPTSPDLTPRPPVPLPPDPAAAELLSDPQGALHTP